MGGLLKHFVFFKASSNWSYIFVTAFLLLIFFSVQFATGFLLLLEPQKNLFLLKYLHCLLASVLIFIVYLHFYKNLFFNVNFGVSNYYAYITGSLSFVCLVLVLFSGSVFSWGTISFWGSKVTTSFLDALPIYGVRVKEAIWTSDMLVVPIVFKRFSTLHIFFSLVFILLVFLHIYVAHAKKSQSLPIVTVENSYNSAYLFPGTYIKDFFVLSILVLVMYLYLVIGDYYFDEYLNNIPIDINKTPSEMRPAWFFWPSFSILKFIEGKGIGILFALFSTVLMLVPLLSYKL